MNSSGGVVKEIADYVSERTDKKAVHCKGAYNDILASKSVCTWGWNEPLQFKGYSIVLFQPSPRIPGEDPVTLFDFTNDTNREVKK